MGMADFQRVRAAFFVNNGRDEDGGDPDELTWDKFDELNKGIVEAWH